MEIIEALRKDIIDAFGPLPKAAETLFQLTELRVLATAWTIPNLMRQPPDLVFAMQDLSKLGPLLNVLRNLLANPPL